jgi:hypothetical protein
MTQLVALCKIHLTPTEGPLSEMTGYDPDGNPIVVATSVIVEPGQFFVENNPAEAAWLIANDAARTPTPTEVEAYERLGAGR